MKRLKLTLLNFENAQLLSRQQMKTITGGLGCNEHADCGGGHICTIVTYNGATQGVCCNAAETRDPNNVCGGGTQPMTVVEN